MEFPHQPDNKHAYLTPSAHRFIHNSKYFPVVLVNINKSGTNIGDLLEQTMQEPSKWIQSAHKHNNSKEMCVILKAPHTFTLYDYIKLQQRDINLQREAFYYLQTKFIRRTTQMYLLGFLNTGHCTKNCFACFWLDLHTGTICFTDTSKTMQLVWSVTPIKNQAEGIYKLFGEYVLDAYRFHSFEEYIVLEKSGNNAIDFAARDNFEASTYEHHGGIDWYDDEVTEKPSFMFLSFKVHPNPSIKQKRRWGRKNKRTIRRRLHAQNRKQWSQPQFLNEEMFSGPYSTLTPPSSYTPNAGSFQEIEDFYGTDQRQDHSYALDSFGKEIDSKLWDLM